MADKSIEYEYIAALQDFSKSIEYLVDAVKSQVDNKKDLKGSIGSSKDMFESMLEMSKQLEVVVDNTTQTKDNTEKILSVVGELKKQRQKGIFDKLSPKDKTKSVVDGIKTISLMAGAILAIGSAFKIVGQVDFEAVLALSIALPLIGETFNRMDKSLSPKDAAVLSLNMVIMATGVAASGYILDMMPELSFKQMISVIGVSVGMGIAMYALSMVADNLNAKEVSSLFLIAAAMPAVAMGLALSAGILANMPEIPFMKTVQSTAAISVSFGIAGLAIAITSKLGLTPKTALLGSVSMVAIAGGLALSSQILSLGDYSNYPDLDWSQGVGLALLASLPVVIGFGTVAATGIGALAILAGIASMIGVAGGLATVSHIVKTGDYTGGPSLEWSQGVGSALMAFANTLNELEPGILDMFSGDTLQQRIDMITQLGTTLKTVSFIIKGGDYTGGPSKEWSFGVGIALMSFANAMDALEPGLIGTLQGESLTSRISLMTTLAEKLPMIATAINEGAGNYDVSKAPSEAWSKGVGYSISSFAEAMGKMEPGVVAALTGDSLKDRIAMIPELAAQLPIVGAMFASASAGLYDETKVPTEAWAKGVGTSLTSFATAIATLDDEIDVEDMAMWSVALMPLAPLIAYFGQQLSKGTYDKYPTAEWSKGIGEFFSTFSKLEIAENPQTVANGINTLSLAYIKLGRSLTYLGKSMSNITNMPDMSALYGGLVTLSLVDDKALSNTLDVLNNKQTEFAKVLSMIDAQSKVSVNDATFAFNKDKKEAGTKSGSSAVSGGNTGTAVTSTKTGATTKANKSNTDTLMEKMVNLQTQLLSVMNEVADNTSKSMATNSDMINH